MNCLVIGGGVMGLQIAAKTSLAGYPTEVLVRAKEPSSSHEIISGCLQKIERIKKRMLKSKQTSSNTIIADLSVQTTIEHLTISPDIVIEAVSEDIALKKRVYDAIDACLSAGTPVFSNTSSLSVSEFIPAPTRCRYGFIHFFNPLDMIPYAEYGIAKRNDSEFELLAIASHFLANIGIAGIKSIEHPGYIGNRLLFALLREAIMLQNTGLASSEDIDLVSTKILGMPTSVSKLQKIVGTELCAKIISNIFDVDHD
jgi:3-hydroxybutyryl-CoA dehydrogenase